MSNNKYYFTWIMVNSLYLAEFVFLMRKYGFNLWIGILCGVIFQSLYYIVFSWVDSLISLIYWKSRKYKMLIIRFLPICMDYSSGKLQVHLDKGIFEFGNVYTFPKIINNNMHQIKNDSVMLATICKRTNFMWIFGISILLCVLNFFMGIIWFTLGFATYMLLNINSDIMFTGGRYAAMKSGKIISETYYFIVLDKIDFVSKKSIYRECCNILWNCENQSTRERKCIEGMIIDSICDGYDYLSENFNNMIFDFFMKADLKREFVFNRIIFIYCIYCKIFHEEKVLQINQILDRYMGEKELQFVFKKMMELQKGYYKEMFDYRNNSYIYNQKIERLKNYG